MAWKTLVGPDELAAALGRPDLVLLDCRHDLADADAGPRAWAAGHLPGAHHAHVERDLSDAAAILKGGNGRHPLPRPEAFRATASRWGVQAGVQVVAYDDAGGAWAARAWWLLRHYGHEAVALLDGGLQAWRDAAHPLTRDPPPAGKGDFRGTPGAMPTVDAVHILRSLAGREILLVDVRDPPRYRGEAEPIDPVAGHIPGAVNAPYKENLAPSGRFKSRSELHRALSAKLGAEPEERPVVFYCGSGVTSCQAILAAVHAGLVVPALYAGSWSEWVRDPKRPVERS